METDSPLCTHGRDRQAGDTAYDASFVRNAPAGRRRGLAIGAIDVGACGYLNNANLYPCRRRASKKSAPGAPSARARHYKEKGEWSTKVMEYGWRWLDGRSTPLLNCSVAVRFRLVFSPTLPYSYDSSSPPGLYWKKQSAKSQSGRCRS